MSSNAVNRWAPVALLAGFAGLCIPLLSRKVTVFDDFDEKTFHLPTIQQFMAQLPTPDLVDYPSATTPLYHLVMAATGLVIGDELVGLRAANLLLSLGVLAVALWAMGGRARSLPFVAALALSPYFVGPAVRLSTDNAALLGVFATVGLLVAKQERPLGTGLAAAAAIMTRQIHAWVLGLLVLRAVQRRARPNWVALVLCAVPLVAIIAAWGALTPPAFARGHSSDLNVHTLIFAVSMFGMYGPFLVGWLGPAAWAHRSRVAGAAALAALSLVFISMPYTEDPLRWGGAVWQIAGRTPELLEVPLSFWVLFPAGAGVLAAIASSSHRGRFLVVVVALWLVANLASARAYQKYYDPMTLFILGMAVQPLEIKNRISWVGPGLLILGLGMVTVLRFYG